MNEMSIQQKSLDLAHAATYSEIQWAAIYSSRLEKTLTCPITADWFSSPSITPCGHTFEYTALCQSLEYKKSCPLDRETVEIKHLTPNLFAKEVVSIAKNQKLMVIFLGVIPGDSYTYRCNITYKPLYEAASLPCGHTFDQTAISEWIASLGCCPLDGQTRNASDIVPDMDKRRIVQETYPQYRENVKIFNANLISKVIELQLDDRSSLDFDSRISEITKCSLSKSLMKNPVVGACGHTFDLDSIKEDSLCPHDGSKIMKSTVVSNRLAQEVLGEIADMPMNTDDQLSLKDYKDRMGVFIFLEPTTTNLSRIGKIATTLGLFTPSADPYPWKDLSFRVMPHGETLYDLKTPLSQIKQLNNTGGKIPSLFVIRS
jgi:predicted Zn-ribbon and HTH transcriptional regulator